MIFHIVYFYRTEGSKPHMKGHMSNFYTLFLYLLKKLLSKMEPGCRSCRRTVIFCINCLITVFVL